MNWWEVSEYKWSDAALVHLFVPIPVSNFAAPRASPNMYQCGASPTQSVRKLWFSKFNPRSLICIDLYHRQVICYAVLLSVGSAARLAERCRHMPRPLGFTTPGCFHKFVRMGPCTIFEYLSKENNHGEKRVQRTAYYESFGMALSPLQG